MNFEINLYTIYLFGLVVWISVYYKGAVRGGSRNPWLFSLIFALAWPLTVPMFIVSLIKSFKK